MTAAKIKTINEGKTEFFSFVNKTSKTGPGIKQDVPFYNPSMEANRDLSITVAQWLIDGENKTGFLDGLAASGARGIRFANELQGDFKVTINDWNKDAFDLIKKNIEKNNLKNVDAKNENLNVLLSKEKYDYIDIDPFGSPIYFVDSAVRSISNNGILACTATDSATLCGVYPKVCLRRYSSKPFHCFFMHEVGLRILLGAICREAAKYEKGIEPIMSYYNDHYFRAYVRIKKGKQYANKSMEQYCILNSDDFVNFKKIKNQMVGPLWMGNMQNKNYLKQIRTLIFEKGFKTKNFLCKFLTILEEEANAPAFFYTTDDISSYLKISPPSFEKITNDLNKKGYKFYRTHFSPTGFKTNAPFSKIEEIFKD